jgi:hypothetical protein
MIAPRISKIQVCHETGDARIQFEAFSDYQMFLRYVRALRGSGQCGSGLRVHLSGSIAAPLVLESLAS